MSKKRQHGIWREEATTSDRVSLAACFTALFKGLFPSLFVLLRLSVMGIFNPSIWVSRFVMQTTSKAFNK